VDRNRGEEPGRKAKAIPIEQLELRAIEERREIHARAEELKEKISEAKEKLDPARQLREHRFAVAMSVGTASLLIESMMCAQIRAVILFREGAS